MTSTENSTLLRTFKLIQLLAGYPPKRIDRLAQLLDVSDKSVYRYIRMLRSLGYIIGSDKDNRYFIDEPQHAQRLNQEEKKLIVSVLRSNGEPSAVSRSVIGKMQLSPTLPDPYALAVLHRLRMIEQLLQAIELKLPVRLLQYRSTSRDSETKDRTVLPLHFDEHKLCVTAYDLQKGDFRIFKLLRMDDIDAADANARRVVPEVIPELDIFGMGGKLRHGVSLRMSKRACAILKEEFPTAVIYITDHPDGGHFPYALNIQVCGYEGIGRFVLGLLTDIQVTGDSGFKKYLEKNINSMTILKI
jgi:proteasome accessory factor C